MAKQNKKFVPTEAVETTEDTAAVVETTVAVEAPAVEVSDTATVVVEEVVEPVVVTETAITEEPVVQKEEADVVVQETKPEHYIVAYMRTYESSMAPNVPQTDQRIATIQSNLYRNLMNFINRSEYEEFRPNFSGVLDIIRENKLGSFNTTMFWRGRESLPLPPSDRKAFVRLLNLLTVMTTSANRKEALAQLRIEYVTQFGFTEKGRNNIMQFLNIS